MGEVPISEGTDGVYADAPADLGFVSRVLSAARAGSIVLMHALPQTADARPPTRSRRSSTTCNERLSMVTLPRLFETADDQ